jgi:PilZ domain
MAERRSNSRQKSFLQGRVFFNNRRHSADCLVRDVSTRGAKLVFSDVVTVPDVFELYLSNKDAVQRAEVQWRRGKEIGVTFGGAELDDVMGPDAGAASGDVFARILKLEGECASLRRSLTSLQGEMRKLRSETV